MSEPRNLGEFVIAAEVSPPELFEFTHKHGDLPVILGRAADGTKVLAIHRVCPICQREYANSFYDSIDLGAEPERTEPYTQHVRCADCVKAGRLPPDAPRIGDLPEPS